MNTNGNEFDIEETSNNSKELLFVSENKDKKPKRKTTLARELFDWAEIVVLSLCCVLLLFSYVGRIAVVDGSSMRNTLYDEESLIMTNIFYTPKRGDIVVFQLPEGKGVFADPLVKRVIALGGDTIYIDFENWLVYVYEDASLTVEEVKATIEPIEEIGDINYQPVPMREGYGIEYPYTVPEGKVFVMGDNRNGSTDSRFAEVGAVDERYILGHAVYRITPFDKMGDID